MAEMRSAVENTKKDPQYEAKNLAELEGITWAVDEKTKKPLAGQAYLRWKASAGQRRAAAEREARKEESARAARERKEEEEGQRRSGLEAAKRADEAKQRREAAAAAAAAGSSSGASSSASSVSPRRRAKKRVPIPAGAEVINVDLRERRRKVSKEDELRQWIKAE